jgi:hypothetical protein
MMLHIHHMHTDDIMEMMKRAKSGAGLSEFDIKLDANRSFACSPTSPLYGGMYDRYMTVNRYIDLLTN